MQNEITTNAAEVALTGRTVAEITADIRVNYRNAKQSIIAIGRDLAEVKQLLRHGEWLPYLQGLNISISSAENYIKYAAMVPGDEQLSTLPYSAAIALLALPEGERQKVQENELEGKSAAEIKRLIAEVKKEKKRADEEAARADHAETMAKITEETLQNTRRALAERPTVERQVTVTVKPDDYDELKDKIFDLQRRAEEAEDAAADAEERAAAAVANAQRMQMQQLDDEGNEDDLNDGRPTLDDFIGICNEFQSKVWAVPYMHDIFRNLQEDDLQSYRLFVNGVKSWAERVLAAMNEATAPLPAEGVIIIDSGE